MKNVKCIFGHDVTIIEEQTSKKRNNEHYVGFYTLSILMNWKVFTLYRLHISKYLTVTKGPFSKLHIHNIDSTDLKSKRTKKYALLFLWSLGDV